MQSIGPKHSAPQVPKAHGPRVALPKKGERASSSPRTVNSCRTDKLASFGVSVVGLAASLTLSGPALADGGVEEAFNFKCAGCHAGGGNVVGGGTLKLPDLEKNGLLDTDELYKIIYSGKGKMPGFGKECAPRGQCTFGARFADEEVVEMSQFVLDKAKAGWE